MLLPITSGVGGLVRGVVFVQRIVRLRYVVFVDAYNVCSNVTLDQGWGAFNCVGDRSRHALFGAVVFWGSVVVIGLPGLSRRSLAFGAVPATDPF